MAETTDGFEIARRDLDIRGPGEFMGARQSGDALLRFADLAEDDALLQAARRLAPMLLREHPAAAQAHVATLAGQPGRIPEGLNGARQRPRQRPRGAALCHNRAMTLTELRTSSPWRASATSAARPKPASCRSPRCRWRSRSSRKSST
jgi:hypothetical protein